MAIQNNTTLVGAWGKNAAYIFSPIGNIWTAQAKPTPTDAGPLDTFGSAVAIHNGTALIGASFHRQSAGAAYVFVQSGEDWNLQAELQGADTVPFDYFGYSVALESDTALMGAYSRNGYRGAAYTFTRANGAWTQQAMLTAPDELPDAYFGISVALSANVAVVGGRIDYNGAAYLFEALRGSWIEQGELRDNGIFTRFRIEGGLLRIANAPASERLTARGAEPSFLTFEENLGAGIASLNQQIAVIVRSQKGAAE